MNCDVHCVKCKSKMRYVDNGSSMTSGLSDGVACLVSGWSCRNCGQWQDKPLITEKPRIKNTKRTASLFSGITSKAYGAMMRAEVLKHFDLIQEERMKGVPYTRIVKKLGLSVSSSTCEKYMTSMRKDLKIDVRRRDYRKESSA